MNGIGWLIAAIAALAALTRCETTADTRPLPAGHAQVVDGDTLEIAGERIRIFGVDAPEYQQTCTTANGERWPCGRNAARELARWLRQREVLCTRTDTDVHNRAVARCTANGEDIGAWLVKSGTARAFTRYTRDYSDEERDAKQAHRGIWQGPHEAPWTWRAKRHPNPKSASVLLDWYPARGDMRFAIRNCSAYISRRQVEKPTVINTANSLNSMRAAAEALAAASYCLIA
jgi:endonuclease YncB( thermonuclease family)